MSQVHAINIPEWYLLRDRDKDMVIDDGNWERVTKTW